jgi:NAD+ synthase (glutamine-hydrolysing)
MDQFGFARIAVCSPRVAVANPQKNADHIISMLAEVISAEVVVFPELCITGYTCGDLFRQSKLLLAAEKAVADIARHAPADQLIFVGAPIAVGNELFNCAIAICQGRVQGIVPKINIPNYSEFYESRWFRPAGGDEPAEIQFAGIRVPFGVDLFFRRGDLIVFAEICEDLWMPIPPSSAATIAGANLVVNLSASNETVGKNEYRTELIKNQSSRCLSAYAYASAGPSESTSDLVFGGHCMICENGLILAESRRVGLPEDPVAVEGWHASADIDVDRLQAERRLMTSFGDASRELNRRYRTIEIPELQSKHTSLLRSVNGRPFVPRDPARLHHRCAEVFGIQCAGLYKRLEQIGFRDVYIGVSGGLDSTLALMAAVKTYQKAGVDVRRIHGLTMPGFGTTARTRNNAIELMTALGISQETIDIREICFATFQALSSRIFDSFNARDVSLDEFNRLLGEVPREKRSDLTFENVQARERTKLLMSRGFVLGTGDLSELALGWCTYNADHMSMYNVNCSVPKTLVKFLVEYVAESCERTSPLYKILIDIANTTISPELLPPSQSGEIEQSTEDVLGPYELHDFYLANFLRYGFSPEKILYLSEFADFSQPYPIEVRRKTLQTFIKRFFTQQFKRNCVPDGPKVGSVSLSPRGDWRMPSDAEASIWLSALAD